MKILQETPFDPSKRIPMNDGGGPRDVDVGGTHYLCLRDFGFGRATAGVTACTAGGASSITLADFTDNVVRVVDSSAGTDRV